MLVLQTIAEKAQQAGLPFLIIGGYAVMAHGFVRSTADLDLLVQASLRQRWRELLEGLGMTMHREAISFLQFNPPPTARLPVDVMCVADEVFKKMQSVSEQKRLGGVSLAVVSLLHLVALKCHAIQHGPSLRKIKDTEDLIQLIRINRLDLNEPELRAIILKHGKDELHEKLRRACPDE